MNNGLSYSHLEIDGLAEGIQEINESVEPTNFLTPTTFPGIHSELGVTVLWVEEGMVSQVGVVLESRDNNDAQDASRGDDDREFSMLSRQ